MDTLSAFRRKTRIGPQLIDGRQAGAGKFCQQLQTWLRLLRHIAQLINLGRGKRVVPRPCRTGDRHQAEQTRGEYARNFHDFPLRPNILASRSRRSCSRVWMAASRGGRSSTARVCLISSTRLESLRILISVSFNCLPLCSAAWLALSAENTASRSVFLAFSDSPEV